MYEKNEIRRKLLESNKWVERGLVAIYDKQTQDEKRIDDARYHNNVGFSAAHARSGSYFARWVLSGRHLDGSHLIKARKLILHYARQLAEIANEKAK